VFLIFLAAASEASADTGAAEALFRAGREAVGRGDHATACRMFAESNRLEPAVGTELNMALCELEIGHLLRAWQLFQSIVHKLPPGDERASLARDRLAEVDARVPRLVLKAAVPLPSGTEIIHGQTRLTASSLDVPIPFDPGEKEIVVKVPGHEIRNYRVLLNEGDRDILAIEPGAAIENDDKVFELAVEQPTTESARRTGNPTVGVLAIGVGASSLVVGAVAGLGVLNAKAAMETECDHSGACSSEGLAAADRGELLAAVSTTAFALGAVCAGAGIWWLLDATTPNPGRPQSTGTGIAVGVSSGGAAIRGSF